MDSFFKNFGSGKKQNLGRGGGMGRMGGGGFGIGGDCVCAKCGEKVPHVRGQNCTTVNCPKCGHVMVRDELLNK